MDSLIPWHDWVSMIDPIYYEGKVGKEPYPIELMLRIIILQSFYDLADMAVMYEMLDSRAFSDFCGVSSPEEVPNGDTIGRFRQLLIDNNIQSEDKYLFPCSIFSIKEQFCFFYTFYILCIHQTICTRKTSSRAQNPAVESESCTAF